MRSILLYIEQGYIQSRLHPEHVYPPTRHVHRSPASSQQLPGLTTAKRTAPTLPPPTTPDTPDPSTTLPTHLQSVIRNHAFRWRSSNLDLRPSLALRFPRSLQLCAQPARPHEPKKSVLITRTYSIAEYPNKSSPQKE